MAEVAIIGIGCRFPGSVHDARELWEFLLARGDGMVEVPADRWNLDRFYDPDPDAPGRMYTRRGGFLTDSLWDFDPEYFGISPREAAIIDPQQRLLLEVAVEALDDAGMGGRVAGRSVGVYVGGFTVDNQLGRHMIAARSAINSHTATSGTLTMLSNRLSYTFDLLGPSMTIDTACSSSLVAVNEAVQSIVRGESELAIAAGVNAMLRPETFVSMCKGRFLAPDGRCKTFDATADGYARGEGAGAVILKPLAAAVADGDRIYAVIRASGVNSDGRTSGITVPNPVSQEALARRVLGESGIDAADIGYVEAHGTGTSIGDPLEMQAIGGAYGTAPGRRTPLVVGSIKAAIGHLEAAAGIASVIKAALVVHHRAIAPQAWLENLNPAIAFDELNVHIPTEPEPFPAAYEQVNVAINGFGYGGTNAHVILSEAPPAPAGPAVTGAAVTGPAGTPGQRRSAIRVLPVSGRTEAAAREAAGRLAELVDGTGLLDGVDTPSAAAAIERLVDAAWSRRAHHPVRFGVAYSSGQDLSEKLRALAAGSGRAPARVAVPDGQRPVFVFSGMGPQWWRMARDLLTADGIFARTAREIDAAFLPIGGWSIIEELLRESKDVSRITQTEVAQPANFLVQVGLVAELSALGIEPAAVLGHSVGEVSAAYVSGALSLHDALLVSCHRARLQATTAGTGGMLAVGLPESEVLAWLEPATPDADAHAREDEDTAAAPVEVAAVNSPSSVTLAGPSDALEVLAARLTDAGIFARALRVEVPYHSALMDPILDEVAAVLAPLAPRVPIIPLHSSVTAAPVVGAEWGAAYWVENVRRPVRFADAMAGLVAAGHRTFVEIGPHPALAGNIREILVRAGLTGTVVATLMRDAADRTRLAQAVAELYQAGCLVTTARPGRPAGPTPHVALPAYPWQRTRLWAESPEIALDRLGDPDAPTLLGARTAATAAEWEVELSRQTMPWLGDHVVDGVVVLPGAAYLDAALAAAEARPAVGRPGGPLVVEAVRFVAPLVIGAHEVPILRLTVEESTRRFQIHSRPAVGSSWSLHATGRLVDGAVRAGDWSRRPGPAPTLVDGASVYADLDARGLHYGPAFRRISELVVDGDDDVRARVDGRPPAAGRHLAHPAVLDCAMQAVAALADTTGLIGPVVPAAVRSVRWFGPLPEDLTVVVRRAPGAGLVADVALVGADGAAAMELLGVEFRAAKPPSSELDELERLWYSPVWEQRAPRGAAPVADGELTLVVALAGLGAEPGSRAREVADRCAGGELLRISEDLDADRDDVLTARLGAALTHPGVRAVTVVVVAGPASATSQLPGTENLAGLVLVARSIEAAVGGGRDEAGFFVEDATPVRAVILTERAVGLPTDLPGAGAGVPARVGAGSVDLSQAGLAGARRVLLNEQPAVRWRLVDTDPETPADVVDAELGCFGAFEHDDADEVVLRDGARLVQRFSASLPDLLEPLQLAAPLHDPERSFAVERPAGLLLADLGLRAVPRRAPGSNEIEVRVISAGLSSKDAFKVLGVLTARQLEGTYFGTEIGMEYSAEVVGVGPDVTRFAVGDRMLLGVRDPIARYLTLDIDEGAVWKAPPGLSDVGCASNVVFLTAHHALVNCARPRPGETVLVHGAAGGVGLAAIQVARHLGARVIGTASTEQRRAAVLAAGADHVLDSRSLDFVGAVRALTDGRGADVIISSAPGEILRANLDAAAEFGRVVEIGKADSYGGGILDLAPFSRNLSFIAIDIDRMLAFDRPLLLEVAGAVHAAFTAGHYTELPTAQYPLSRMQDAFEAVLRSSHIGRVALRLDDEAPDVRPAVPRFVVHPDATYLVTGGFGAFGLATARWLADRGARHLALVGRRGATTPAALELLGSLRSAGVEVVELLLDVADAAAVGEVVRRVVHDLPALRGVFHAAGVLDDQPYRALTEKSLRAVLEPKVLGAWNLHHAVAAAGIDLDAFVLYSSVTSMVGTVPQLAYAAANATLDALAHERRGAGLPALTVNWGALSGGGMAESSTEVTTYLSMIGLHPIDMAVAARTLDDCLRLDVTQVAVVDIDWGRWAATHPATAPTPRVAAIVAQGTAGQTQALALRAELIALGETQRVEVVSRLLAEQVAGVLGIAADTVDLEAALPDLGLDSLMAVELGARVNMTFGVEVSALELSRGGGLSGLAVRLVPALTGVDA